MSDDYGTVNVRGGGERAREIEILRQHYRRHRDALQRMITDAPTEVLAGEYRRLAQEIERAIGKLDELEGKVPLEPAPLPERPHGDPLRAPGTAGVPPAVVPGDADSPWDTRGPRASEPGMRPLHPTPGMPVEPEEDRGPVHSGGGSRILLILGAALVALALIGWLIWRASDRGGDRPPLIDEPVAATETVVPVTETVPPEPESPIAVSPATQDYGVIRKGTRAMRRFEIANQSEEPVTIQFARSTCRCLYYVYDELIPPKAKISATVTVDAAKAPAGQLREIVVIASRSNPAVRGSLEIVATVQ